ncbi:TonB-dependent receptor [Bacteroides ihuae]|uniref:TonB-dependent receptor n=1 Tax=Bacteroides ihuae TaxID=1852362 RepID=UPI0008D957FC|nr:TonB-dependent receptor [Bacteroides ihuae]
MNRLSLIFITFLCFGSLQASNTKSGGYTVSIRIIDSKQKTPLEYALIYLSGNDKKYSAISDEDGKVNMQGIAHDKYQLTVSYLGYEKYMKEIILNGNLSLTVLMKSTLNSLDEVVVTASESKGMTSSSIIDRKAMEHLQPSSFSDLLELLPGGYAVDPSLTSANSIDMRGVSVNSNDYKTSSLGTSFLMDGVPISTDANMQYTSGPEMSINGGGYADASRSTTNKGIDMRSLSTDQIERVEFIRGIPSAKYGNLTSGLVKIERKKGAGKLEGRFKVDSDSKLLAISKGLDICERTSLNLGLDFLDARADPTDKFEGYQRINTSMRLNRKWLHKNDSELQWNITLDYEHTLDDVKTDPDTGYTPTDSYKSSYNRFALSNNLLWIFNKPAFLKKVELITATSYELDKIEQHKFVQITAPTAIPNTTEQGESDGIYLPANWVSELIVDGKPLSLFAQGSTTSNFTTLNIVHNLLTGLEWTYDKNFGKGQVYDVTRPPSSDMSTRPRRYSDIPANQEWSFFAEDAVSVPLGRNQLQVSAGVRGMSVLNLGAEYAMNGKVYIDPRINTEWTFPIFNINKKPLTVSLSAGIGWQSKTPTLNQLYPDFVYNDIVQLNYYHNNPDYRRINLMTYKNKVINYDLEPARNRKWEVRLNASYDNNNLSVTYFRESMTNGFRTQKQCTQTQVYKRYDSSAINSKTLTAPPDLANIPYTNDTILSLFSASTNGSATLKEGVEFTFSSKRIEALKTRLTITGAWFKTNYDNSIPIYRASSQVLNGKAIQEIGIYESTGGYEKQRFNTNFMFDTYIPIISFEFSTSLQCVWFSTSKTKQYSGTPLAYVDLKGETHPYTEIEMNDARLQWLNIAVSPTAFQTQKVPFGMNINLKMSKTFKELFRVSLFVNKLLDYHPDYVSNGVTIRRNVSPYFGTELTFKL